MDLSAMFRLFGDMGPNLYVLLLWQLGMAVVVVRTLLRLRRGETVRPLVVLGGLCLPLLLGVLAHTVMFESTMRWADTLTNPAAKYTVQAVALSRAIGTQLLGGMLVSSTAVVLVLGAAWAAGPGSRPQERVAVGGAVLTWVLSMLVMVSGAVAPDWTWANPLLLTSLRGAGYLAAGLATTLVLFGAPKRGPGAAGPVLTSVAMPLLVAGADAALLAYVAGDALVRAAQAPVAQKESILSAGVSATDALSWFSWGYLGLAVGLAGLGLLATRQAAPEDVPGRRWAVLLVSVSGVAAVSAATLWTGWLYR